MDRNEAIEHLKVVLKTCDVQDEEAVEMAIAALEGKDTNVPTKEEAIPVDWIESYLSNCEVGSIVYCAIKQMLYKWREEQTDGHDG